MARLTLASCDWSSNGVRSPVRVKAKLAHTVSCAAARWQMGSSKANKTSEVEEEAIVLLVRLLSVSHIEVKLSGTGAVTLTQSDG